MKPFLVRARIPDLGPSPSGAIVLYVAMFGTKEAAVSAVKAVAPGSWSVEDVVGVADDSIVQRKKLSIGQVELLA
ncbi:hypothetical protein ABID26_003517 [Mesorhizobium shonense]|uniref:Uncharacterized protein n=1 Tax=Mesorhizobium shonense TaxID=1209948 RepID=A0ABV2HU25_9HYPH|nr:hypothetical protein [Mesorhizobium sp.]TIS46685.1 MAG: hypothetical protein E5W96_26170 [Mesorhizobium sp.]